MAVASSTSLNLMASFRGLSLSSSSSSSPLRGEFGAPTLSLPAKSPLSVSPLLLTVVAVHNKGAGGAHKTLGGHVAKPGAIIVPLRDNEGVSCHLRRPSCLLHTKSCLVFQNTKPRILCAISMSDGWSGDDGKINLNHIMDKARKFWEDLPHPVKSFPWGRVRDNFIQVILYTAVAVIKYLSAPLLAISALSEMSYAAHERKLFFVPIPLALGFVVAGILKETALELSPLIKDAEVPWHLIAIAIFSILLKLPGPYYPYWGRIFIPHFANGALLRVFWVMYLWYRRPKEPVNAELEQHADNMERK